MYSIWFHPILVYEYIVRVWFFIYLGNDFAYWRVNAVALCYHFVEDGEWLSGYLAYPLLLLFAIYLSSRQ